LADGNQFRELRKEIERCVPCEEETKDPRGSSIAEALQNAILHMGEVAVTIAVALAAVAALLVIVRGLGLLLPRIALALVPQIPLVLTRLSTLQGRLTAQQAANDGALALARRAANDDTFRALARAGF
jgi:hypothetical protein